MSVRVPTPRELSMAGARRIASTAPMAASRASRIGFASHRHAPTKSVPPPISFQRTWSSHIDANRKPSYHLMMQTNISARPLRALLPSPALGVRLMTALQVLQGSPQADRIKQEKDEE